jgi:glycerophosphoryl diester phosphodiesterase
MGLELLKSVTGRTLVESHRGVVGQAPENSWTAIKLGQQLGADLIEVDVQISQDGIPFLRHNYQLPDGQWCNQLDWNTLKNITVDGEPLPRLDDVLIWAHEIGVYLSLDIKTSFSPENNLSEAVVKALEKTKTKEFALLLFLDHNELFQIKRAYPDTTVRALSRGRFFNYAEYLKSIGADCASISYDLFRPIDIEKIHAVGISVVLDGLWNPNVDLFENLDIDIFTYDDPVDARRILKHHTDNVRIISLENKN